MREASLASGDSWKPSGGHLQLWERSHPDCSVHEDLGPRGDCGSVWGMGGEEVGLCSPAAFPGFLPPPQKQGSHHPESQPGNFSEDGRSTAGILGLPSVPQCSAGQYLGQRALKKKKKKCPGFYTQNSNLTGLGPGMPRHLYLSKTPQVTVKCSQS